MPETIGVSPNPLAPSLYHQSPRVCQSSQQPLPGQMKVTANGGARAFYLVTFLPCDVAIKTAALRFQVFTSLNPFGMSAVTPIATVGAAMQRTTLCARSRLMHRSK